jgi:hypothetical protein
MNSVESLFMPFYEHHNFLIREQNTSEYNLLHNLQTETQARNQT